MYWAADRTGEEPGAQSSGAGLAAVSTDPFSASSTNGLLYLSFNFPLLILVVYNHCTK